MMTEAIVIASEFTLSTYSVEKLISQMRMILRANANAPNNPPVIQIDETTAVLPQNLRSHRIPV